MTVQVIVAIIWTCLLFLVTCVNIGSIGKPREPKPAAGVIGELCGSLILAGLIWWMALS